MAASSGLFGDKWWKDNLRMTQDTFEVLVTELRPLIEKKDTHMRKAVGVEERIAVTIWKLATTVEYRTLAALFGLGRSTVGEIVLETCQAIATKLFPRYVCIPQGNMLREVVDGFEKRWDSLK